MKKSSRSVSLLALVASLGVSQSAFAYDFGTHSRIAEKAIAIMQVPPSSQSKPPTVSDAQWQQFQADAQKVPPGANPADWAAFLAAAQLAPARLSVLQTGFPSSLPVDLSKPLAHFAPPAAPEKTTEAFPFDHTHSNCTTNPQDDLSNVGKFRIEDFHYDPQRDGSGCGVIPTPDPLLPLQRVMGWHAGKVDDYFQDVVMWYRPTNALAVGALTSFAENALEKSVGALLIPFVCLFELFSSGGCDTQDSFDLATKIDPIPYIDSWFPGFGKIYGSDYTGLWHFIDEADPGGRFNDTRGMLYESAGRDHPGVLDVGILVVSDVFGLSLHASESDGVANYAKYDRVSRTSPQWQSTGIGHLEWSPLDHLAEYGWDKYLGTPTSAQGLGWALHAIGDAAEPHHVTGTTSWGHRPYEDFVEANIEELLPVTPPPDASASQILAVREQDVRVLANAFPYYQALAAGGTTKPVPASTISQLVKTLATGTYAAISDADWPFNDSASLTYLVGSKDEADSEYLGDESNMQALIEPASSAALALLVYAANFAQDAGLDPSTVCPSGTHFGPAVGCVPGVVPPPVNLNLAGVCVSDGTCGVDGGPTAGDPGANCTSDSDCDVGYCASNNVCSTDCSSHACAKGTCEQQICCFDTGSTCKVNADCCGDSTCSNGVCTEVVVK